MLASWQILIALPLSLANLFMFHKLQITDLFLSIRR